MSQNLSKKFFTQLLVHLFTMMKTQRRKRLTLKEADFYWWEHAYYKNNVRASNPRAHAYAWRRTRKEFPNVTQLKTNPLATLP